MANTQETVTVYVDDVAFEVDYQFDNTYAPQHEDSDFVIVGIAGYDEETGECEDFTKFLNCGKNTSFYQSLVENTLDIADSDWQKRRDEELAANECDNSRW